MKALLGLGRFAVIASIGIFLVSGVSAENLPPAKPKYTEACIFKAVAARLNIQVDPEIPFPPFYYASQTPLKQFQDAIEPQWGFRPDQFLNSYISAKNEIYILDDGRYYQATQRFIDDSIAHELAHYVQVKYRGWDLTDDESLEYQAIEVQTWFRETYARPNAPIDADCVPNR